jgi:hypothetical protein
VDESKERCQAALFWGGLVWVILRSYGFTNGPSIFLGVVVFILALWLMQYQRPTRMILYHKYDKHSKRGKED